MVRCRLDKNDLSVLLKALGASGREIIGPTIADGAIVYAPIDSVDDLPKGVVEEQAPGRYRLIDGGNDAYFDHVVGPHAWKRYLYPAEQKLWSAERTDGTIEFHPPAAAPPERVFFGVRSCDLSAIRILDRVFDNGTFADTGYRDRRAASLIVAVNCGRAGETCFCGSMQTGPKAEAGFDLALTEVSDGGYFVIESGSPAGADILETLALAEASQSETAAADARVASAAKSMKRKMIADAAGVLGRSLDSPRWNQIAERCLNCANCTMACPTCFCTTVEDTTDLSGEHAERWRKWDSCFTLDFSYIHGGSLRRSGGARFRQWMTHKLAHWHDQFGTSGCVGCGRCISWCPVGIDITEEARIFETMERED